MNMNNHPYCPTTQKVDVVAGAPVSRSQKRSTPPSPGKVKFFFSALVGRAIALFHFVMQCVGVVVSTFLVKTGLESIIGRALGTNGSWVLLVFSGMFLFSFTRSLLERR